MDASADVDINILDTAGIQCLPMEYSLGDKIIICKGRESAQRLKSFYDSQRGGDLTHTTQIAPHNYIEVFSKYMSKGYSVLYLSLSSGLSSTYDSAVSAKAELEKRYPDTVLYVVDTLGATAGIGMSIERAVANKEAGMSIEENFADLEEYKKHIQHILMVPDLMYLKRGGRVNAASAVLGTALNIIPILEINDAGRLAVTAKKRGPKLAIKELVQMAKDRYDPAFGNVGYIVNADDPEMRDLLTEKLSEALPNVTFKQTGLSPIIGAHTGPGLTAVVVAGNR